MAQRKYHIFIVNGPPKPPTLKIPQHSNQPQRDTPIATLAHLNRQTIPSTEELPSGEVKHSRRSMFLRRNYKRSLSTQGEKYSYNLNHISQEGDFLNCNILDCYIVDREGETLRDKQDKVERDSQEEMKKFIEKVEESKKKREEWKKGNVVPDIQESTVTYHAQFRPYQEHHATPTQPLQTADLHSSPEESFRKRVNIFEKQASNRPNSFLLQGTTGELSYSTNPQQPDAKRKRAVSLQATNIQSPSFLGGAVDGGGGGEPQMSTIHEQTSEISSIKIHEENAQGSNAVRKLFLQE